MLFFHHFKEAVVFTADGVGEWATTTVAVGKENNLEIKKRNSFSTFSWTTLFCIFITQVLKLIVENIS